VKILRLLLASLVGCASSHAHVNSASTAQNREVDAIFSDLEKPASPGCALGVYRDGRLAYARGYGFADLEHGARNGPSTVFDIGSTSKQFTAVAIALLVRDKKLAYTDDIRRYVPELHPTKVPITIDHLLHHTSGLRDYIDLLALAGHHEEDLTDTRDALAILARQRAPNFEPGTAYLYSNTGYMLLSVIVERVTQKRFSEFAHERILRPLGMRSSLVHDDHRAIVPNRAIGYSPGRTDGTFDVAMSNYEQTGDGAIMTTVEDLLAWNENFYTPRVGDRQLISSLEERGVLSDGTRLSYARGLRIDTYRGLKKVSHSGSWAGYRAQLLRFPERHLAVACLCNLSSANPSERAQRVADHYLGFVGTPDAFAESSAAPTTGARAGAYRHPRSGEVRLVSVEGDAIVVEDESFHLVRPGLYRSKTKPVEVWFSNDPSGTLLFTESYAGSPPETFKAFVPVVLNDAERRELVAAVAADELGVDAAITLAADGLHVTLAGRLDPVPLTPTVRDAFIGADTSFQFTRGHGTITGFTLSTEGARNIVFTVR
jgi:CubicO group peptidase (beta-lactamase class C family)